MTPFRGGRRTARAWAGALAASVALVCPHGSPARPLQLEDLLQREGFGALSLAPGGRWLLVEQRSPFAAASRFDFDRFNVLFRTELKVADLSGDLSEVGPLRTLTPAQPGVGYQAGPISPDGARAVIYRLTADCWELGLATFSTGEVRWLGLTPEVPGETRTLQWLSPQALVAIVLLPGDLPFDLRAARPQAALPRRWSAQAQGEAAVTVVGSGRFLGARPQSAAKRIVRISADSGAVATLATGDFVDLELSGSARRLALVEAGEDIPLAADRPVQGRYGIAVRRMRLRLLDLKTGWLQSPCPSYDVLTSLLSWSERGDQLLAYVRDDGAAWTDGRLIRVDGATGAVARVGAGLQARIANRPERVMAGWWGDEPLLLGRPADVARDDWYRLSARGPVRLTGGLAQSPVDSLVVTADALLAAADGAAWRIDRAGRAKRISSVPFAPLPRRVDGVPSRTTYALRPGARLPGQSGVDPLVRAVRLDGHGRTDLSAALGSGDRVLALGTEGAVLDRVAGGGAETLVWRGGHGEVALAQINQGFADVDRPVATPVAHRGPNGEPLQSWILAPPAARGGPPPLVVVSYPGHNYPHAPDVLSDGGPMASAAVLVGHGYAVLLPSLPTWRAGQGPADGLAAQVLAIIDAAAQRPELAGLFDPTRLGLWGHSFGGYAVAAIVGQTDRFRGAVAIAAPTDLVSFYGEFDSSRRLHPDEGVNTPWTAGWMESLQGDMGAPPWTAADRYRRNSPLMQAARIHTPLLLAAGDQDGAHLAQAEELFSALFRQGKDALLLSYWGEGHVFGSPGDLRDLYARGLGFLDDAFKDGAVKDRAFKSSSAATGAEGAPAHPGPAFASGAPRTPAPPSP